MVSLITEEKSVQRPFIKYAKQVGWEYITDAEALSLRGGVQGKFFYNLLEQKLIQLNPFLNIENAQRIIGQLENIPDTLDGNKQVWEWLCGRKSFHDEQEQRNRYVQLIDFNNPDNNDFFVTYEWTHAGHAKENRSDIMLLINGIPLAIVENKNPKKKKAMEEAIVQFKRYEEQTPEMLCCPQVFNITDVREYFYGVTWNYSRKNIFNWKKELGHKRERKISLEDAVSSFFNKEHFLKFIEKWVLFFNKDDELNKTVLQQHQIRAVEKIDERCIENKDRGLIWHTQGSGKTFTMITAARVILLRNPSATVMMIIDRNELEDQLSGWIAALVGEMRQGQQEIQVQIAKNKRELQGLLDRDARGLIVSMLHKFDNIRKDSCTRQDFYVLIDEAHRSVNKDLGNYLMAALPNATLFGFTGTPVDKTSKGKGTFKIFGIDDKKGYLDKYSISESIEDGTTLKLKYESVPNQLRLLDDLLEEEFLKNAESEGVSDIDDLNAVLKKAVRLKEFLKADERVKKIAQYVAEHFQKRVQPLGYKAFLVAVDREACALYKRALDELLPKEMSKAVYTPDYNDSGILREYQIKTDTEKQAKKSFKKTGCEPHILIVTDKLLTGYDAPILYCMYLDKPMRDHVLLQAIARVNRPYEDDKSIKPCGLVVDFVGIFKSMTKALAFDPDEVNAVIEDLDLLFDRFKQLIDEDLAYLPSILSEEDDKLIEKLLYEDFQDFNKRALFTERVKELETAYEILSPSSKLQPYLLKYRNIIEIYKLLKGAYSGNLYEKETKFLEGLSRKTERLLRENPQAYQSKVDKTFEINVETLKQLKKDKNTSDEIKVMNLIKSILKTAEEEQYENPALIPIADKANDVLDKFKNNQKKSKECLRILHELSEEIIDIKREQKVSGLGKEAASIYRLCEKFDEEVSKEIAKEIAIEIDNAFKKFENFNNNTEELRQLKIEIYAILLPSLKKDKLANLVAEILKLMGKVYENR